MSDLPDQPPVADAWLALRRHTAARIALGRTGASLPTTALLDFGIAHAQARDAVHAPLDVDALQAALAGLGLPLLIVASRAPDRSAYLARPDWGRSLAPAARVSLEQARTADAADLVIVISDGLSASGVQQHAAAFVTALLPLLAGLRLAPLVIATQARVALADEVGALLGARMALSVIGERPGLSSADSLGLYLTHAPQPGRNDAERNCISNVRPAGLPLDEAAGQAADLIRTALKARCSGVALRYEPTAALPSASGKQD